MNIFDKTIMELRGFVLKLKNEPVYSQKQHDNEPAWPKSEKGSIVLKTDTGVELGNPRDESVSFILWTNSYSLVNDNRITLIGPDIDAVERKNLPFGKVIILGVKDFTGENCYERHREIDLIRYDLNLEGYMMRAVSQYMREWSRVSRNAIEKGFSLFTLGKELIKIYKSIDYIELAEVIFITSSTGEVKALKSTGQKSARLIGAMNKMTAEMSLDCDVCDYLDVCGEIEELRSLRKNLKLRR